ncbi:MAG TPA: hypothetical protein VGV35_04750 [Bryobacteraceae bacterium]|nr:hypothetical protein [Bryobacteraceae bacterium]
MNENEQELLEGLRALSADSPREAPAYMERRLLAEFRQRQSAARRRNVWWTVGGVAAVAAAILVMLWMQPAQRKAAPSVASVSNPLPAKAASPSIAPVLQPAVRIRKPARRPGPEQLSFYALPDSDALPPLENATVVRVQLPMSSLRLIGFPISEDRAGERIQADVLLGQDGLARGVRLVQ